MSDQKKEDEKKIKKIQKLEQKLDELKAPDAEAQTGEKAEYAVELMCIKIELEALRNDVKLGFSETMVLSAFRDMLPAIFQMAPKQAEMYCKMIYDLMGYINGYTNSPSGE